MVAELCAFPSLFVSFNKFSMEYFTEFFDRGVRGVSGVSTSSLLFFEGGGGEGVFSIFSSSVSEFVRFKEGVEVIKFGRKVGNVKVVIEGRNEGGDRGSEYGVSAGVMGVDGCRRLNIFFVRLLMLLVLTSNCCGKKIFCCD